MGYFYWLHFKNLNHLHTELSLDFLKDTKFCVESKASFVQVFDCLVAGILHFFGQFRG